MNNCKCNKPKCGCAKPILSVEEVPDQISVLRFNDNGVSTWYDYKNMINQVQTDTSIRVDAVARVLEYMAERHIDTISARELGSILHLADIADVDEKGIDNNSLLVYKKDADCAEGCSGINNSWNSWTEDEHRVTTMKTIMGYDDASAPVSLTPPANASQYYQLGWNAENKVSWTQPVEASTPPLDSDNKKWRVYVDPTSKRLTYVKESS